MYSNNRNQIESDRKQLFVMRAAFGALRRIRRWTRKRLGWTKEEMLKLPSYADRFQFIYKHNLWSDSESVSGSGSTIDATELFRKDLVAFIEDKHVSSMLDAPCGDFHWMRHVPLREEFQYIGGDIVDPLIEHLKAQTFGDRYRFCTFDILHDPFPKVDLWLCRDCLFHLSFEDVKQSLKNFACSTVEYALLTCNYDSKENIDIVTGDWRPLDLRLPPLCLPDPQIKLRESVIGNDKKFVGCWTRKEVEVAIAAWE